MKPQTHKTVGGLQSQATGQTQQIVQLNQVISTHLGGTVTIQAIGTLNLTAGGNLNLTRSTIDLKDAITGVHGPFKADTDDDYPPPYTPGASNLWW
jgi:hypothetical protein